MNITIQKFLQNVQSIANHPMNRRRKASAVTCFVIWRLYKLLCDKPILVPFVNGLYLYAYPSGSASYHVIFKGLLEFNDMMFAARYLRAADYVADIGANDGTYTTLFASLAEKVFAFEPHPLTYQRMMKQISINELNNVSAHQLAIADKNGKVSFSDNQDNTTNRILDSPDASSNILVQMSRFENIYKEEKAQPALIKIDVEGAELSVLTGIPDTLLPKVFITEINGECNNYGTTPEEVFNAFIDRGYRPYRYDGKANTLTRTPVEEIDDWIGNLIFIKTEHLDEARSRIEESSMDPSSIVKRVTVTRMARHLLNAALHCRKTSVR